MPSGKWERQSHKKNHPFICHVRKFREEMGLSTRKLAKICGVTHGTIIHIEQTGGARIGTALVVAKALNRCIEELWEPKPGRKPMKQSVALRETTAGDVLRRPRSEQFEAPDDFAAAMELWREARPL